MKKLKKLKNWILNSVKNFWDLNLDAKIGVLLLIPPIIGVFMFILNMLFGADMGFDSFPESWNCLHRDSGIHTTYGYGATPAMPLYLGLMAIAGAYLIKGNLKND